MRTLELKDYKFVFGDENAEHSYFSFFNKENPDKLYGHREIDSKTIDELYKVLREL